MKIHNVYTLILWIVTQFFSIDFNKSKSLGLIFPVCLSSSKFISAQYFEKELMDFYLILHIN